MILDVPFRLYKFFTPKIVNKKSGISPNIALRIQTVSGGSAEMWTKMQHKYDMVLAIKEFERNNPKLKRFEKA
ncbi:hypothetical protein GCM10027284_16050 [Cyclobacterium sediminis]